MRTSLEIQNEITNHFGFFPPFFAPAIETPQVFESLWQQTLSAYINNPLPALFKEKLASIVAQSCNVPYCLVCHSCTLRPLGMTAGEVLDFLENWDAPSENNKASSLQILAAHQVITGEWPTPGSALENAILCISTLIFFGDDDIAAISKEVIRVVGKTNFDFLCLSIAYNKTCILWAECHSTELSYEADQRAKEHLQPLLAEEPRLANFFANYRHHFSNALKYQRTKKELETELTERKLSEAKFKYIYECGQFGLGYWNASGQIVDANQRLLDILNFARKDMDFGLLNWNDMTPPEYSSLDQEALRQINAKGHCSPFEKEYIRKDGTRVPVMVGGSLSEGKTDSGIFYVIDLTEKKNSERAIQETQTKLETVLNHAPLILWATDEQGVLTYCDGKGLFSVGIQPGLRVGESLFELYQGQPNILSSIQRALAGESFSTEVKMGDVYFDSHYAPLCNNEGDNVGMVGLSTDITARKKADADRAAALYGEATAKEASLMKSAFLATMSHEIRTPLNGVIGMNSLLLDTNLSVQQQSFAESVQSSAEMLLTLINDILDLSKAEAGKIELEQIDFNLEQLMLEIEETFTYAIHKKGLKLFRSIPPHLHENLKGDPTRLKQIIVNLLNNALKFTHQGSVTLQVKFEKTESKKTYLRFEVSDTGIGISKNNLGRLFNAFSQADPTTTRRFGGTGLGLSICKHLVGLMEGDIGVKSEEGKGSTFWFVLPFETETAHGSEMPMLPQPPKSRKLLRVLIAEDDLINQIVVVKLLEKFGHHVVAVGNGQQAIEALSKNSYDLVFMDCQMPTLDGYETTKYIRSSTSLPCRQIPIIAMTANAMNGDREKCIAAGMNDYVSKPMKLKDLTEVIERTFP